MFEKTSNTLKNTMSVQISKGDASFLPSFFFRSERKRKKRGRSRSHFQRTLSLKIIHNKCPESLL